MNITERSYRTSRDKIDAVTDGIEVHVEKHCWTKMFGWCNAAKSEVSGVGLAYLEDGIFHVYDVFFPKQYGSGSYTELDDVAMGRLNRVLYKKNKKKGTQDLKFWWHTHYNFNTFWSGTDDDNAQNAMKANGEWEVSIVINQKGDWLCRVDMQKPFNITLDKIPVKMSQNSRKVRRKRNFKQDIKRWVKPLDEMPEYQRNNAMQKACVVSEPSMPTIPDRQLGYEDYCMHDEGRINPSLWMQGFRNRFKEEEDIPLWKSREIEANKRGNNREVKMGSIADAKDGDIVMFGEYKFVKKDGVFIRYLGTVDTPKEPQAIAGCTCSHIGDWQICTCPADCNICLDMEVSQGMAGRGY